MTQREKRVIEIQRLKRQGLTPSEIAERLELAPTTIRDYLNDPTRAKARKRQRKYPVTGVAILGTPVDAVKPKWKSGAPAGAQGMAGAAIRGRQMRAIIGKRARGR